MKPDVTQFEWDEAKREKNWIDHRVDFLHAAMIFKNWTLTRVDDRKDYGEERLISLGLVNGEAFVVVHTQRGGATRMISAWKGGRHDKEQYYARFPVRPADPER